MTAYLLCLILFGLGLYCILSKRNIIKMIIGVVITQYAVNLFFVLISYTDPDSSGRSADFDRRWPVPGDCADCFGHAHL